MVLYVHMTGFGEFGGMKHNPTTVLIEQFATWVHENRPGLIDTKAVTKLVDPSAVQSVSEPTVVLSSCDVLKVSANAVHDYLKQHFQTVDLTDSQSVSLAVGQAVNQSDKQLVTQHHASRLDTQSKDSHLYIHLGVASCFDVIRLECRGINQANFSIPDQDMYQPIKQTINQAAPQHLFTSLNVPKINYRLRTLHVQRMMMHSPSAGQSIDPSVNFDDIDHVHSVTDNAGDYVCNYTLFNSLLASSVERSLNQTNSQARDSHSIFIHVPEFRSIDLSKQLNFLADFVAVVTELYEAGELTLDREAELSIDQAINQTNNSVESVAASRRFDPTFSHLVDRSNNQVDRAITFTLGGKGIRQPC